MRSPTESPRSPEPLASESVRDAIPASLPLEPHDGLTPVAITSEWEAIHLVSDPLPRTIARVALPAIASSLLMTLFTSVDAPQGDKHGFIARTPRWYRRTFAAAGLIACGTHCYIGPRLKGSVAALEHF